MEKPAVLCCEDMMHRQELFSTLSHPHQPTSFIGLDCTSSWTHTVPD